MDENDIITTEGLPECHFIFIDILVTKRIVLAAESPVYFNILEVCLGMGTTFGTSHQLLPVLKDALKKAVQKKKINACLLISNFSNPLGSCMPDEQQKGSSEIDVRI